MKFVELYHLCDSSCHNTWWILLSCSQLWYLCHFSQRLMKFVDELSSAVIPVLPLTACDEVCGAVLSCDICAISHCLWWSLWSCLTCVIVYSHNTWWILLSCSQLWYLCLSFTACDEVCGAVARGFDHQVAAGSVQHRPDARQTPHASGVCGEGCHGRCHTGPAPNHTPPLPLLQPWTTFSAVGGKNGNRLAWVL